MFAPVKGESPMTAVNNLISYISNLTPEQVEKVFNHLPQLISLLEEASQPCPLEQSLQNQ